MSAQLLGLHTLYPDTSKGIHEVTPACNSATTAGEIVYKFVVPAGMTVGIDAR